jgi:hypothetical protein
MWETELKRKRSSSKASAERVSQARLGARILVIPDTQVKPGVPINHLPALGRYIAEKRPDYIVMIGDWWDMESLCSYDKGKKTFEGRRYLADIKAGNDAMNLMTNEYRDKDYTPQEHLFLGNHENRLERAVELQPELEGIIGYHDLNLAGWTVHPFLEIVKLEGIAFSHYFTSGVMGRPASSAAVVLREVAGSAIQGHVQRVDVAVHPKTGAIAMMVGTFYQHDEIYLGLQGNNCRRQVVMLNECRNGTFDPMFISLNYLLRNYS